MGQHVSGALRRGLAGKTDFELVRPDQKPGPDWEVAGRPLSWSCQARQIAAYGVRRLVTRCLLAVEIKAREVATGRDVWGDTIEVDEALVGVRVPSEGTTEIWSRLADRAAQRAAESLAEALR